MRQHIVRAVSVAVVLGAITPMTGAIAAGPLAHHLHAGSGIPLFSVGISGGFTGASMTARVYPNGDVRILRQGAGRGRHTTISTVPLTVSSVRQVIRFARSSHVFAIPSALQNQPFGADVPIRAFTIYSANGARSVHVYGSETSHIVGTERFFPVWGLLDALAGYPTQLGN